jgi:GNAT superfamily N-acetyltransferase
LKQGDTGRALDVGGVAGMQCGMETNRLTLRTAEDVEPLVPILFAAMEDEQRLREWLSSPASTAYAAWVGEDLVGAVSVRWDDTSEIDLLAVVESLRGRGHGTAIVAAVLDEARSRGVSKVEVGTANFSLANILFYQKCRFRMSYVRRDFFAHVQPPVVWRGMALRDMIVFDYALDGAIEPKP